MMFLHFASFNSDMASESPSLLYEGIAFSRADPIGCGTLTCIHSALSLAVTPSRGGQLAQGICYSDCHGSREIVHQVAVLRVIL
jgi:hypothetical protein